MPEGRVVQCLGGFQTVLAVDGRKYECVARGRIKKDLGEIVVGDLVSFTIAPGGSVIEGVMERRNLLRRPTAANVDQAVLVFALRHPDPDSLLIDRFLTAVLAEDLPVVLCFNKLDLVKPKVAGDLAGYYEDLGFKTVLTSALTGRGRNKLLDVLHGRNTVFCGPSGVGKSALLNLVQRREKLATGEISAKIGRGRHTTRAARLLPVGRDGYVIDTPGYTRVDLSRIAPDTLAECFPEFAPWKKDCRFSGCRHLAEPDCAVKRAVKAGAVSPKRYEHYCAFMDESAGGADRR